MPHAYPRSAGLALVLAAAVVFTASPAAAVGGIYNWYTLPPGQSVEWIFHYPGDNAAALIAVGADPARSLGVNVYDDVQWQELGLGYGPVEPVGRGTPGTTDAWKEQQELLDNGSLFWEARARPAVIFHIHITNLTQAPAHYWIAQAGPGVGDLAPWAPAATATTTPQPTPTAKPPAAPAAAAAPAGPPKTLPVTGAARPFRLFSFFVPWRLCVSAFSD